MCLSSLSNTVCDRAMPLIPASAINNRDRCIAISCDKVARSVADFPAPVGPKYSMCALRLRSCLLSGSTVTLCPWFDYSASRPQPMGWSQSHHRLDPPRRFLLIDLVCLINAYTLNKSIITAKNNSIIFTVLWLHAAGKVNLITNNSA